MVRRSIFTPPAYTVICPPPESCLTTHSADDVTQRKSHFETRSLVVSREISASLRLMMSGGGLRMLPQGTTNDLVPPREHSKNAGVRCARGDYTGRRRDTSCVGRRMKIPEPTITKAASARVFSSDDRSGASEVSRRPLRRPFRCQ